MVERIQRHQPVVPCASLVELVIGQHAHPPEPDLLVHVHCSFVDDSRIDQHASGHPLDEQVIQHDRQRCGADALTPSVHVAYEHVARPHIGQVVVDREPVLGRVSRHLEELDVPHGPSIELDDATVHAFVRQGRRRIVTSHGRHVVRLVATMEPLEDSLIAEPRGHRLHVVVGIGQRSDRDVAAPADTNPVGACVNGHEEPGLIRRDGTSRESPRPRRREETSGT